MSPAGSEWKGARRWLAAAALFAGLAGLGGCGERAAAPGATAPAPQQAAAAAPLPAPSEATMELGRAVWNYRCYFCHGYSGDAKTLATSYLSPRPRNFQQTRPEEMPHERVLAAVRHGVPNTAMKGFTGILNEQEMEAVSQFLRQEFLVNRAKNTRYHTKEAGWPDHERYAKAFPFARGEIAIDTPWDKLTAEQQEGMRMFRTSCITCHDHGKVNDPGTAWESRPVSFPRDAYCISCHQDVPRSEPTGVGHPQQRPATHTFAERDGSVPVRSPNRPEAQLASNYVIHDTPPKLVNASALELQGERLFQKNCAFCHAGDGTSKGWIGSFLEPHPRDLTDPQQMRGMTRERLLRSINEGIPDTSMPAWKSVMTPAEIEALAAYIHKAFHPVQGMGGTQAAAR